MEIFSMKWFITSSLWHTCCSFLGNDRLCFVLLRQNVIRFITTKRIDGAKKLRKSFAKNVRWIKRKIRLKKLLSFVIVNYETRGLLQKVWTAPIDNYELWAFHKWSVFFFKDVNDDKKIRLSLNILYVYQVYLFFRIMTQLHLWWS